MENERERRRRTSCLKERAEKEMQAHEENDPRTGESGPTPPGDEREGSESDRGTPGDSANSERHDHGSHHSHGQTAASSESSDHSGDPFATAESMNIPVHILIPPPDWSDMVRTCKIGGDEPVTIIETYLQQWPMYLKRLRSMINGRGQEAIDHLIAELSRQAGRDG